MGMFLSKYSMLNALGYGDDPYILPETKKILSRFKLFGLIIHDPAKHQEFHRKLEDIFERIDYLTGQDFLFLCLTDPPKKWIKDNNRDYFGIWETEQLLSPGNATITDNDSITAYTLCQSLEIDYDDLPAIILTNDFTSSQFRCLKTSARHLEKQLTEIGHFSSQKAGSFNLINDQDFNILLKNIDYCSGNFNINNEESLAKTLSDFLSFILARPGNHDQQKATKQVNNVLVDHFKFKDHLPDFKSEQSFLKHISTEDSTIQLMIDHAPEDDVIQSMIDHAQEDAIIDQDITDSISNHMTDQSIENSILDQTQFQEKFQEKIKFNRIIKHSENRIVNRRKNKLFLLGSLFNLLSSKNKVHEIIQPNVSIKKMKPLQLEIASDLIEEESKLILKTYNAVSPQYTLLLHQFDLEWDFSPLILSLSKIFEIEVNLSLVHWIRSTLQIEMPQYYRKRKPALGDYFITPDNLTIPHARPIDFNKGRDDKWIAPGIGESELAFRSLHIQNKFPHELINNVDAFLEHWKVIRNLRNKASHTETMDKSQYEAMRLAFNGINNDGYLDQLVSLKQKYKPK